MYLVGLWDTLIFSLTGFIRTLHTNIFQRAPKVQRPTKSSSVFGSRGLVSKRNDIGGSVNQPYLHLAHKVIYMAASVLLFVWIPGASAGLSGQQRTLLAGRVLGPFGFSV